MSEVEHRRLFQFSLRWLLIGFASLAVALYVLYIRPTAIAERLVHDLNAGDATGLMSLRDQVEKDDWRFAGNYASQQTADFHAALIARSWADVFSARRRIIVNAAYPKGAHGTAMEEEISYYVTANIVGLKVQQ